MKERPILFSAPMVQAILAGTKTQTRRIVKPQPDAWCGGTLCVQFTPDDQRLGRLGKPILCPYGVPGDRLWVRETWAVSHVIDHLKPREIQKGAGIVYYTATENTGGMMQRPSIFMPRWASRITLEITDVRVERLQEISEEDALAEGAKPYLLPVHPARESLRYVEGFAQLWEQINGPGSWDANPWVWAINFRRTSP